MPRVPPRSTREVEQLLRYFGLRLQRRMGPHDVWGPGINGKPVPVPRARSTGELSGETIRSILRGAGISVEDALKFWGIR